MRTIPNSAAEHRLIGHRRYAAACSCGHGYGVHFGQGEPCHSGSCGCRGYAAAGPEQVSARCLCGLAARATDTEAAEAKLARLHPEDTASHEELQVLLEESIVQGDLDTYSLVSQALEGQPRAVSKVERIAANREREAGWDW